MVFKHDSTGISTLKDYTKLQNKKRYNFKIVEAKEGMTKNGDPIVYLKLSTEGKIDLIDHSVVFLKKGKPGEGISVHFRKTIGMPYGGNDDVDATLWIGKEFSAWNTHKEYNGKLTDSLNNIEPVKEEKKSDDVPF